MRIKEFKHKFQTSPYYTAFKKLTKSNQKLTQSIYLFRWKNLKDNYTYNGNRFHYIADNLIKRLPFYTKKNTIDYGLFKICYSAHIGQNPYTNRTPTFSANVYLWIDKTQIKFDSYQTEEAFQNLSLPDTLNIDNLEKFIIAHVSKYIYPEGFFQFIQFKHNCNKKWVKWYYQNHYLKQTEESYDSVHLQKWIQKKFNIDGRNVSIEKLVQIVNKIGKQSAIVTLHNFYTGFINYIDGDIDEMESEFYLHNPITKHTLYV